MTYKDLELDLSDIAKELKKIGSKMHEIMQESLPYENILEEGCSIYGIMYFAWHDVYDIAYELELAESRINSQILSLVHKFYNIAEKECKEINDELLNELRSELTCEQALAIELRDKASKIVENELSPIIDKIYDVIDEIEEALLYRKCKIVKIDMKYIEVLSKLLIQVKDTVKELKIIAEELENLHNKNIDIVINNEEDE